MGDTFSSLLLWARVLHEFNSATTVVLVNKTRCWNFAYLKKYRICLRSFQLQDLIWLIIPRLFFFWKDNLKFSTRIFGIQKRGWGGEIWRGEWGKNTLAFQCHTCAWRQGIYMWNARAAIESVLLHVSCRSWSLSCLQSEQAVLCSSYPSQEINEN